MPIKMPEVDLAPFVKVAWKSERLKGIWAERILRVSRAYHEAEYLLVKKRMRKCATIHINWNNAVDLIEKITTDGLIYLPIRWSKMFTGFAHRHLPTQKGDPNSFVYGVLSYDLEYAKQFREAEQGKVDHYVIGSLLGYPICCQQAFIERWNRGIVDPLFEAAELVGEKKEDENIVYAKAHPYANPFLRYFGIRITSHLPCSVQCKETIKIGKVWIDTIREVDNDAAKWAMEILEAPIKWNILKGIAQIETPLFFGIANTVFTEDKKEVILEGADGYDRRL